MFHTIRKQDGTKPVWFHEAEVQKYVKVGFVQRRDNWYLPEGKGRFTYDKIAARQCTVADFNAAYGDEFGEVKFKEWTGFSLVCPDLKEG